MIQIQFYRDPNNWGPNVGAEFIQKNAPFIPFEGDVIKTEESIGAGYTYYKMAKVDAIYRLSYQNGHVLVCVLLEKMPEDYDPAKADWDWDGEYALGETA